MLGGDKFGHHFTQIWALISAEMFSDFGSRKVNENAGNFLNFLLLKILKTMQLFTNGI